jgi:hypothetical protein
VEEDYGFTAAFGEVVHFTFGDLGIGSFHWIYLPSLYKYQDRQDPDSAVK